MSSHEYKVGDRVKVKPAGLSGVRAAGGLEATIADGYTSASSLRLRFDVDVRHNNDSPGLPGQREWWGAPDQIEPVVAGFKVGDRVRMKADQTAYARGAEGCYGVIVDDDGASYRPLKIRFDEPVLLAGASVKNLWVFAREIEPVRSIFVAGDRVKVKAGGLCSVKAAAGLEATIDQVWPGRPNTFDLLFDVDVVHNNGVTKSRRWAASRKEVELAPPKPAVNPITENDSVVLVSGEAFTDGKHYAEVDSVKDDIVLLKTGGWLNVNMVKRLEAAAPPVQWPTTFPGLTFPSFARIPSGLWAVPEVGTPAPEDDDAEFEVGDEVTITGYVTDIDDRGLVSVQITNRDEPTTLVFEDNELDLAA
ncbi:MAG: hypothetical protein ACAH27_05950 [Xanthobacteraceae bacterium]